MPRRAKQADAPIEFDPAAAVPVRVGRTRQARATVKTAKAAAPQGKIAVPIPREKLTDERWYVDRIGDLVARRDAGQLTALEAKRDIELLASAYEAVVGEKLSERAKNLRSPLERLEDERLLELNDQELVATETAILALDGLSPEKKTRWCELIDRTRKLQVRARASAEAMWVYVGRDSETGGIFHLAPIHRKFFAVWADDSHNNSLIEAPPSHGKTTCFQGQKVWDVCQDQRLRCLILLDSEDKARKEIAALRRIFRSGRLRALYPHIRVLGREDGTEDSTKRFTVTRVNWISREPTFEAAGAASQINGNGYERVYIDDPCPQDVESQPSVRQRINDTFQLVTEQRLRNPARARIRMICTQWHPDDLAGKIVKDHESGTRPDWRIEIGEFAVHADENGEPISLWPERYDTAYYLAKKARLSKSGWSRLYGLRCLPDEARIVSRLQFYPADPQDGTWKVLSSEDRQRYMSRLKEIEAAEQWLSIDPSATSGRQSSEVAVMQFALTAQGRAYLTRAWFFPGNPVAMQQWLVAAICREWPTGSSDVAKSWALPRTQIDRVLNEAQGGTKGQVILWKDYVLRELRLRGRDFVGRFLDVGARGRSRTGQNNSKGERLRAAAAYLENGFVKFPGTIKYMPNIQRFGFTIADDPAIRKLARQILEFPSGSNDGVDAVTQWVGWNESRFVSDEQVLKAAAENRVVTPAGRSVSALFQKLRSAKPEERNEYAKEHEWLVQRSHPGSCVA